jgi:hypothetical protein
VRPVVYIEGGGNGNQRLEQLFKRSWTMFFKAAGLAKRMPRIVRGGARNRIFDLFARAIADPRHERLPLLLVDSEATVAAGHSPWQHLNARDDWDQPRGARDDHAFLMVQLMETWLVADRNTLREYFGASFRENALPRWPALEAVAKRDILDALDHATARCPKPYTKGHVSFELLARTDPARVENACPHAKKLLDRLRTLCPAPSPAPRGG